MDWKTLRKDKLERTASYRPSDTRMGSLWGVLERMGDVWGRFLTLSWWEKGLVIGTGVLFTVFAPVAAFAFMGGGGDDSAVVAPTDTPIVIVADGPTPTITPQATSTPKRVAPTPTPRPPNRKDCDEIRGTNYQSDAEREWYVDNCEEPTETPTNTPRQPSQPPSQPPSVPTNTPVSQPSITAAQAKSLAVSWISSSPVFSELIVTPGLCSASGSGGGWTVTCTGSTPGCDGAACNITVRVCVSSSGSVRQC